MASAQGHLTVRRRAKDGTNGADAVRYWLVPSATQIKKTADGKYNPTSVSCKKMKSSGNSSPVETTEGVMQYQILYEDGSASSLTTYSSAVAVPSKCSGIRFLLKIGNVEVASESVSVLGDGKGITDVEEYYAKSSSNTVAPSTWSKTVPELDSTNKYLWNYERVKYSDGTHVDTTPAVIGVYGKGISSVTNYYLATSSSSGVTTSTSGWTTTVQSPTSTKRYLWNYEVIVYTDNTSKTIDPHIIGVYGEMGDDGPPGDKGDKGDKGDDAISVVVSGDSIVFKENGGLQRANVRVSIFKGNTKISANGTCSILLNESGKNDGTITSGLLWSFSMARDDENDFLYELTYGGSKSIVKDIPFTVTVGSTKYYGNIHVCTVANGAQGIPGKAYQPIRCRDWSDIAVGSALTTGIGDTDQWTDVVYQMDSSVASGVVYWKCVKDFTKQSGQTPPKDSDTPSTNALVGYLQKSSGNFGMLATDIFLANYVLVKNLGVETIEMRDAAGNLMFQAKNGVVTCNTGTFKNITVSGSSTFRGTVYASAGEFTGKVTATSGEFTGKVTATSGSFNGSITAEAVNLRISTQDHNGETSPYPNGSICINATRILLPELAVGTVRTIRVLNPFMTRTSPGDLILSRGTTNVRISSTMSIMDAQATEITISQCGVNSGAFIELFGFNNNGLTYWLANITKSA